LSVSSDKTLGGVAACLFTLGVFSQIIAIIQASFPSLGTANLALVGFSGALALIGVVAFILFLIAMYGLSKAYGEKKIFVNLIYGIVAVIVAAVVGAVVTIIFTIAILFAGSPTPSLSTLSTSSSWVLSFAILGAILGLIWIIFNVRALNLLADRSNVPLFRTGAKLLLAGAATTIAVAVILTVIGAFTPLPSSRVSSIYGVPGGFITAAAWMLLAMAYFRMKPEESPPASPSNFTAASSASNQQQIKYCTSCGAQIQAEAVYCSHCGKKQLRTD